MSDPGGPPSGPELLLIGHVSRDLLTPDPAGPARLGGTVSFAAVTAARLELRATVITRAAENVDFSELCRIADVNVLPSDVTTTFLNVYHDGLRDQFCFTPAPPITAADLPSDLCRAKSVLLGPLVGEVDAEVAAVFDPQALVTAVPQGWMRQIEPDGRVTHGLWKAAEVILPHLAYVVLSLEDIDNDLQRLRPFFKHVTLVVLTEYRDGSTLYQRQPDGSVTATNVPPRPATEVDPTGAGDVFAAAFLIRMREVNDAVQAAWFANVVASFSIEHPGVTGIPTRAQVMAYIAAHPLPALTPVATDLG